jgi:hypothetical protein
MLASEAQSAMAALSDHLPVRGQSRSPRRLQALNALRRSERAPLAGFVRDFPPTPTWPRQSRRVLPGDFPARGDFAARSHPQCEIFSRGFCCCCCRPACERGHMSGTEA